MAERGWLALCASLACALILAAMAGAEDNVPTTESERPATGHLSDDADSPTATDVETDPDELTPEEEEAILELDIGELNEIQVVPSPFSRSWGDGSVVGESRQQVADSSTANVVSGMEASTRNTTDVGSLLGRSQSNPGV
ncbi:MAG: hypothetical protein QF805_20815, partial [Pirellulaceae bacterium]|nr:hypothetical protein [Pirellulaceae bacterium]